MPHRFLLLLLSICLACSSEPSTVHSKKTSSPSPTAQQESPQTPQQPPTTPLPWADSILQQDKLQVQDYYLLLPESPYFKREVGDDGLTERLKGIRYQNARAGYLLGGHVYGPDFTMALFKGHHPDRDYLMIQHVRYPGNMFADYFHFVYRDEAGDWQSADSLLPDWSDMEKGLGAEEVLIPIVPEKGTALRLVKWDWEGKTTGDTDYGIAPEVGRWLWDGSRFMQGG